MSKGAWVATDVDSAILAADENRREVVLQHTFGDGVFLSFGGAAVPGQGVCLDSNYSYFMISDARAQLAIHARCSAGQNGSGGFQTL